jgi:hypothetical protein
MHETTVQTPASARLQRVPATVRTTGKNPSGALAPALSQAEVQSVPI